MKEFLSNKGINYDERDVTANSQYADELVNQYGYRAVPVTVIGSKVILGFEPGEIEKAMQGQSV